MHEDDAIIVVDKPPHFPCDATFSAGRDNLKAAVVRYLHRRIGLEKNPPYCGLVHRLDRDTSGVMLFSKKRSVNAALFKAFDSSGAEEAARRGLADNFGCVEENGGEKNGGRDAEKVYAAICCPAPGFAENGGPLFGFLKNGGGGFGLAKSRGLEIDSGGDFGKNEFFVQNYIGRISPKSAAAKWGFVSKEKGGKFAKTGFRLLKKQGGLVLVEARLFTGRTHQIRVHLSQAGLPILGDELYGAPKAERIFLHALSLELVHPESKKPLTFSAPLPKEFASFF